MPIRKTGVVQGHTERESADRRPGVLGEPTAMVDGGPQASAEGRQEAF
jgi:hypothetical protein